MAASSYIVHKALQKVEEHLNCSVCLENFTRPKFLPCHHAFCQDCLGHLPYQKSPEGRYSLKCPMCQRPAYLPEDGIAGFPTAFHIANFMEVRKELSKLTDTHKMASVSAVAVTDSHLNPVKHPSLECSKHDKNLNVYCHTCDQLICHECTFHNHKGHKHDPISDGTVFAKYQQEVESSLLLTQQRLDLVMQAMTVFNKRTAEITENRDRVKAEARAAGEEIIAAVRQSVIELEKKADTGAEKKLRFMFAQMEDAQIKAAMLQSCMACVEEEMRLESQQQILARKGRMVESMAAVTSQIKETEYLLTEEPNMTIYKSTWKNVGVGEIEFSTLADRYKVSGEGILKTRVGQRASFILAITSFPGNVPPSLPTSLISCQLLAPEDASPTDCSVKLTEPGQYVISYTPVTSGSHQLRVRVGGVDIPDSPFTVQVVRIGIPHQTVGGLSRPWGVAVSSSGVAVVSECSAHRVTVLKEEGTKSKSIASKGKNVEQVHFPRGVAITHDNKIVVSDESDRHIKKFDMDGRCVAVVGDPGNRQPPFKYTAGVVTDKSSKILVVDKGNHCIHIMDPDLTFSHSFGGYGSQIGQFKYPYCVATDSEGMIYVTDNENHRVQKFSPNGSFVAEFGKKGTGEGEFMFPRGIAINATTDTVYVSSNHKVSVFTNNGQFLTEFGREGSGDGELRFPRGLAVDENTGDLYVCDYDNNRLVVY